MDKADKTNNLSELESLLWAALYRSLLAIARRQLSDASGKRLCDCDSDELIALLHAAREEAGVPHILFRGMMRNATARDTAFHELQKADEVSRKSTQ